MELISPTFDMDAIVHPSIKRYSYHHTYCLQTVVVVLLVCVMEGKI